MIFAKAGQDNDRIARVLDAMNLTQRLFDLQKALLAAGRTQWRAGERVRFYRAQHGAPVWLPNEADDASPISEDEDTGEIEGSEESLFSAPSAAPLTE